jgi:hypothetical protein
MGVVAVCGIFLVRWAQPSHNSFFKAESMGVVIEIRGRS